MHEASDVSYVRLEGVEFEQSPFIFISCMKKKTKQPTHVQTYIAIFTKEPEIESSFSATSKTKSQLTEDL